jgi:ribosomal protein S8E
MAQQPQSHNDLYKEQTIRKKRRNQRDLKPQKTRLGFKDNKLWMICTCKSFHRVRALTNNVVLLYLTIKIKMKGEIRMRIG